MARGEKVPANIEREQSLLGAILLSSSADAENNVADEALPLIDEALFFKKEHKVIFDAIRRVWARGNGLDANLVFDELQAMGKAGEVGGMTYLAKLGGAVASPGNWRGYLRELQEQALRRKYDELLLTARANNIEGQDAQRDKALTELEAVRAEAAAMAEGQEALGYQAELVCLADVKPEEVHWLWKPYLPSRKMTILAGPQGVGKSFLSLAIATAVSSGKPLPAQDGSMFTPPQGNVVILADEDDWGDTIRPRLDAMGANPSNVYLCKSKLDARTRKREPISLVDVPVLRGIINETQPKLVIVDTVHAFIGGNVDPYKMSSVRPVLANIGELARECDTSFLLIMHLAKGQKDRTLDKLHGSVAFAAVVRSVLMVGRDPKLPSVSAMAHEKINIAAAGRTVRFSLANGVFEWAGLSDATATEIFEPDSVRAEKRTKLEEAVEWLQEQLNDGPVLSKELESEAKAVDILPGTLRRAGEALGVVKQKQGGRGGWTWSLPRDTQSVLNI